MYLLFDIGGTHMRLAVSKDGQSIFGESRMVHTPQNFEQAMELFAKTALELRGEEKISYCIGGTPGPLNQQKTMLVNAPNLPMWNNQPLAEKLESLLGCKVILENDAALAGLGEATYGAGKDHSIVAYITVSTGVGGSRIVSRQIDKNALGFEPGHQIIVMPEMLSGDLKKLNPFGYLEGFVSGTAIVARYGKIATEITDEKIWDELALYLAYGLNNIIVHWSPDVVVLGGSVITRPGGMPLEKVSSHLARILKIFPTPPPIYKSALENLSGLYGAMSLVRV